MSDPELPPAPTIQSNLPVSDFDSLIVGSSNHQAVSLARVLSTGATSGGGPSPVVFFGPPGTGKTHLLNAMRTAAHRAGRAAWYVDAANLGIRFSESISDAVSTEHRSPLLVLIDNLQALQADWSAQTRLNSLFDELHHIGQLVIACDRPVDELQAIDPGLQSRLHWGITLEVAAADHDHRRRIVEAKAGAIGVPLAPQLADEIADLSGGDIRRVESILNSMAIAHRGGAGVEDYWTSGRGQSPSAGLATGTIESPYRAYGAAIRREGAPSTTSLISSVCDVLDVDQEVLLGLYRGKAVVMARQVLMYCLRESRHMSYAEIAQVMNRNASTAHHGCRAVEGDEFALDLARQVLERASQKQSSSRRSPRVRDAEGGLLKSRVRRAIKLGVTATEAADLEAAEDYYASAIHLVVENDPDDALAAEALLGLARVKRLQLIQTGAEDHLEAADRHLRQCWDIGARTSDLGILAPTLVEWALLSDGPGRWMDDAMRLMIDIATEAPEVERSVLLGRLLAALPAPALRNSPSIGSDGELNRR